MNPVPPLPADQSRWAALFLALATVASIIAACGDGGNRSAGSDCAVGAGTGGVRGSSPVVSVDGCSGGGGGRGSAPVVGVDGAAVAEALAATVAASVVAPAPAPSVSSGAAAAAAAAAVAAAAAGNEFQRMDGKTR